jgi:hypothetical protein
MIYLRYPHRVFGEGKASSLIVIKSKGKFYGIL